MGPNSVGTDVTSPEAKWPELKDHSSVYNAEFNNEWSCDLTRYTPLWRA